MKVIFEFDEECETVVALWKISDVELVDSIALTEIYQLFTIGEKDDIRSKTFTNRSHCTQ